MKQFVSVKPKFFKGCSADQLCRTYRLDGCEVYFDDIVPRDERLLMDEHSEKQLSDTLFALRAVRAHASYWAWPTAFLTRRHYDELVDAFGSEAAVAAYYGDTTGEKMFSRWCDEYALCKKLGMQAYTWHLIDYAPIDGKWEFTLTRREILDAMAEMLARFLARLEQRGLLDAASPRIELENAGWGLEYGAQSAEDFCEILSKVEDPCGRLCVAWDVNHLLHALGEKDGRQSFFLPEDEITPAMRSLASGGDPVYGWLRHNLLSEKLRGRVGAVHLSDRALPDIAYFMRGKLCEPYYHELMALEDDAAQEDYGVRIVLGQYDSHLPLGTGVLGTGIGAMLKQLDEENEDFALLHELKNTEDIFADLGAQLSCLGNME